MSLVGPTKKSENAARGGLGREKKVLFFFHLKLYEVRLDGSMGPMGPNENP